MSRFVQEDYLRVLEFLQNYTISDDVISVSSHDLNEMHKKMYSFLIFDAEICEHNSDKREVLYIKETLSDIVTALFCWTNGIYKPASMVLRSSIENFLKFIIYTTNPNIFEEQSVYKIFDEAKENDTFTNEIMRNQLIVLKDVYSKLCEVVHSGETKLISANSLGFFPKYEKIQATSFKILYIKTLKSILSVLYFKYHNEILIIEENPKRDFLRSLEGETIRQINSCFYC